MCAQYIYRRLAQWHFKKPDARNRNPVHLKLHKCVCPGLTWWCRILELENRELGASFSSTGSQMGSSLGQVGTTTLSPSDRWRSSGHHCLLISPATGRKWAGTAFSMPAPQKLLKLVPVSLNFITWDNTGEQWFTQGQAEWNLSVPIIKLGFLQIDRSNVVWGKLRAFKRHNQQS